MVSIHLVSVLTQSKLFILHKIGFVILTTVCFVFKAYISSFRNISFEIVFLLVKKMNCTPFVF